MAQTLLTTQQVRDLLGVDASTISRMAGDGRLPAVRVGRQWRFRADAIHALLTGEPAAATAHRTPNASLQMPSTAATAALEAVAPVLGVSMVVTDLGGRPVTPVVNPAPDVAARLDDPAFLTECIAEWRDFAGDLELAPRFRPGRYGFLCAHALVRRGSSLVGMVLAGGIAPAAGDGAGGGDPGGLFALSPDDRAMVLSTLPRVAALLSLLVSAPETTAS